MQSTLPAAVAAVATVAVVAVAVAVAVAAVAAVAVAVAVAAAKAAAAPVRLIIISGPALSRARAASTPLGLALRPVEVLEAAQHVRGGAPPAWGRPGWWWTGITHQQPRSFNHFARGIGDTPL